MKECSRVPISLVTCLFLGLASAATPAAELVFVSDLNGRYGSTEYHGRVSKAAEAIIGIQPELVVSTGDMVAGQSAKGFEAEQLDAMWGAFRDAFGEPLAAAGITLAVTAGNHDGSAYPGFEKDRASFEAYWLEAGAPEGLLPGSQWPWRYAIKRNGLLAITFDGTLPGVVREKERTFVATMLERHGENAEWTLVFSHLPFWPLAKNREREIIDDPAFLDLLHEAGVDVYASGHHHLFYAGLDDAGMLHLSVGALGGNTRAFAMGGPRQPHGMVSLRRDGEHLDFEALIAPGFVGQEGLGALPDSVPGPAGTLRRAVGPVPLRH